MVLDWAGAAKAALLGLLGRAAFAGLKALARLVWKGATMAENERAGADAVEEELVLTEDIAAWLKMSERTVMKWAKAGKIPSYPIGRKSLRFRKSEIARALGLDVKR